MNSGLLVISGCPRSGTSVCMDIQRVAHGEQNLLAQKFPQQFKKDPQKKLENLQRRRGESEGQFKIRKYSMERQLKNKKQKEDDFTDMNPEGFWEMEFTVKGIVYSPKYKETLKEVLNGKNYVCKVVSQGLLNSDPKYIDRIIYMIRHPRAVAKSQERLKRQIPNPVVDGKEVKIHTPEMFIQVTSQAARFLLENPEIPIRFFHYEELIQDPKKTIDDMQNFVSYGDYKKAYDIVQPRLNRSKHEDVQNALWDDAMYVYEEFSKAAKIINDTNNRDDAKVHFKNILTYLANPKRNINREKQNWKCYRAKMSVNQKMCQDCIANKDYRENLKKHSEGIKGQVTKSWQEEPCMYECGRDVDREEKDYLSIEESIENNFWKE
ncbi:sulfotransferase domain-containing protein [Candidatus Woesearchaeota archaeon]|nr:sulfotransferase domain-containing protein [Candidatus Woesearchaeota archaeon]